MIKEAYCSFEVAKLFKEKGFDEPCRTYYEENKLINDVCVKYYQWNSKSPFGFISAPTHQMAMAWLREEKGLFIDIGIDDLDWNFAVYDIIHRDENLDPIMLTPGSYACHKSYEDAVEAALKYALENLI